MGAQPSGQTIGQIPFDDAFPGRSVGFAHELHLDNRLTLPAVADLADRLPRRSVIADTAAQPLLVPQGGPPRGVLERPGDVIRDLQNANAWLTLLMVEDDPGMAEIMNTYLDQLEAGMSAKQGKPVKMRKRVAFVFVSSPNSVTPVHFDIEHSLLMQVSGCKTVSVGRFESDATRRHELASDDLVVATVTAFEVAGRVSLYQSARLTDHRWRDATTVLLAAIIDDACARGFKEVDFLRGDEPYKGRFTRNQREMMRLVAGRGVIGRLGGVAHAARFQATQTAVRCVRFGRSTVARWRP